MKISRGAGLALAVAALAGAAGTFAVYSGALGETAGPGVRNSPTDRVADESVATLSNGRLILPTRAGQPAVIAFDARNPTSSHVYITEARLLSGGSSRVVDLGRVSNERISHLAIPPRGSLRVSPANDLAVLAAYDETVIPGATVNLDVTFSDASSQRVPLLVESALGQGGRVEMPRPDEPS